MIRVRVVGTDELDRALALQHKNISAEKFAPLLKYGTDMIKAMVLPTIPSRTGRLRKAFISVMAQIRKALPPAAYYLGVRRLASKHSLKDLGLREPTPYLHLAVWGSRPRYAGTRDFYRRPKESKVRPGFRRFGERVRAIAIPHFGENAPGKPAFYSTKTKGAHGNPQIITTMKSAARRVCTSLRRIVREHLLAEVRKG